MVFWAEAELLFFERPTVFLPQLEECGDKQMLTIVLAGSVDRLLYELSE